MKSSLSHDASEKNTCPHLTVQKNFIRTSYVTRTPWFWGRPCGQEKKYDSKFCVWMCGITDERKKQQYFPLLPFLNDSTIIPLLFRRVSFGKKRKKKRTDRTVHSRESSILLVFVRSPLAEANPAAQHSTTWSSSWVGKIIFEKKSHSLSGKMRTHSHEGCSKDLHQCKRTFLPLSKEVFLKKTSRSFTTIPPN